jgi:predicted polyphosphate/ATP-dependent NAD kinase
MWRPIPKKAGGGKRLGLIVNPLAGIGGRVGLKGSDGIEIQRQALALGARPQAGQRAKHALEGLGEILGRVEIITPPGEMGTAVVVEMGYTPRIIGEISSGASTAEDTRRAAKAMLESQVDLLLFAGGDGTARDVFREIKDQLAVVGIPAGVKIHSAVFATHPRSAGELAAMYLRKREMKLQEAEVVDLEEEAYREGRISTRLYGYLMVPHFRHLVQNSKAPTPASEAAQMEAIAREVVENMQEDYLYVLGPGTTTRAVAQHLGFEKTLVGVDVITKEQVIALDVNERQLLDLTSDRHTVIILTPIGGQGFLFGRGNQPISPKVIMQIGKDNLQVICTTRKLNTFGGRSLLVDTGDVKLDGALKGHTSIITGYKERAVYRIG